MFLKVMKNSSGTCCCSWFEDWWHAQLPAAGRYCSRHFACKETFGYFWIYLSEIRQEAMVFTIRILCRLSHHPILGFVYRWSECSPRQFKGLDCWALAFHCQWQQDIGDAMHLFVEFITCHTWHGKNIVLQCFTWVIIGYRLLFV